MYITPLSSLISVLNHHLHADDTQLFLSIHPSNFHSNINHSQNALQQISSWTTANRLTLNSSKTEFLLIHPSMHPSIHLYQAARPISTQKQLKESTQRHTHTHLVKLNNNFLKYYSSLSTAHSCCNLGFICRAMRCISAAYAVMRCLSVSLSLCVCLSRL